MKLGLAQINTANGDIAGNDRKIRSFLKRARAEKIDVIVFPELTLVGYPPKDFLFEHEFIKQAQEAIAKLAYDFSDLHFILGSAERNYNVAYVISHGKIQATCRKNLLPNYDVFDERRYFEPGNEPEVVNILGKKIGITICEDIWAKQIPIYHNDPVHWLKDQSVDFVVNLSASPFEIGKHERRHLTLLQNTKVMHKPIVYVNLVGGNDELIFDGGSFVMNEKGVVIAQAPRFEECFHIVDMDQNLPIEPIQKTDEELLASALTLGLRDFVRKSGFQDIVFGLSGGIDSALVLLLAVEALGKEHVHCIFMPSTYTSQASKEDVSLMIEALRLPIALVPITNIFETFVQNLESSLDDKLSDLTLENMQARIRGNILMSFSAQKGAMVLNTGNKSETAVGYSTLYGDTIGGVSVIGDLFKHQVYSVAKFLNQKYCAIPERVFSRAPSAELRNNQKDSDSLPPYEVLDAVLQGLIENQESVESLVQKGFNLDMIQSVICMINNSEFKRKQMPPILRISKKSFGIGRRMPLARKQYDI